MYIGVHLGVLFSYNNVDTEVTKKNKKYLDAVHL